MLSSQVCSVHNLFAVSIHIGRCLVVACSMSGTKLCVTRSHLVPAGYCMTHHTQLRCGSTTQQNFGSFSHKVDFQSSVFLFNASILSVNLLSLFCRTRMLRGFILRQDRSRFTSCSHNWQKHHRINATCIWPSLRLHGGK